jgi:hypothetical protein
MAISVICTRSWTALAGDNEWSVTMLAGRSRLIGNGLLPDEPYGRSPRGKRLLAG